MKVILLKDVAKLGKRFDIKDVSSGHGLNLLIPQGHAIAATADAVKRLEVEKKRVQAEQKVHEDLLVKNIKDLEGVSITIFGKANDKGHLFAGIHKDEIVAELVKQTELQISSSFIDLEHPLKEVGEYPVKVNGGGKSATFKVVIEKALKA